MNAGIAAYVILTQNTDVTDIVGVNIFPEVAEQETATPFIVYQLLSVAPEDTHDGPSTLDEVRFEFLCYADSYALAADLGSKVRGALDRVSGTYNGVNVESIQFNDVDIDTIDAPRRFAQVLTFTFRIKRDNVEIAQGTPVTGAKLGDLYDVDTTGVTDGQVIAYDAAAQEWQPADDAGGVTQLGQLTDVQFGQGGPESGDLLKYDGSDWTNDSLTKSEIGLGNVDNTSDASKPVSTATQTELNAKANSADFSNVDNTSDANKPVSTATQTALNAKADTSAVPTDLNDLSDVSIVGTPAGNQALIYDVTAGAFKSQVSYTNRFEDEVETGINVIGNGIERAYSVKAEGDGIYLDASPDTPTAGKVIKRKIYQKTGFISDSDAIGDYTLIHTFADDTTYSNTVATFDGFEDGATYGVPPFTLFQTWEEVTAAPAFTGLLNETYGSGAEAAYSTRRLNGNVTDCMVIRRASDSTTTTIGFDGSGNISEADITTFCTGTSCTVYQWLDQSGNDNTATAAAPANEPTIYTGGALVKENGKVALDFDGSDDNFTFTTTSATNNCFVVQRTLDTAAVLFSQTNVDNRWHWIAQDGNTSTQTSQWKTTTGDYGYKNGSLIATAGTTTRDALHASIADGNQNLTSWFDFDNAIAQTYYLGRYTQAGFEYDGQMQEVILYPSDKSSVRTSIEENVGDYFTQNTPLLDTYTGAAAAYSLRKLRTAYTGDAVEVYNGSSYADIGFNVFSELDTVALADHCGSNDGFVSKWYDQSGNTNTAAQTVTGSMPKIYDGTTGVVTEGGKPAVEFDGSNDFVATSDFTAEAQPFYLSLVTAPDSTGLSRFIDTNGTVTNNRINITLNGSQYEMNAGNSITGGTTTTTQQLLTADFDTTSSFLYKDGAQIISGDAGTRNIDGLKIGANKNGIQVLNGTMQEIVFYASDQSSNRTGIESNVNTFYSIY